MGRGAYTIRNAAAALQTSPILTVEGGAGNDVIELERTKANPWRLDVYEYPFGTLRPPVPTSSFQLASIQQIILKGNGGDDRFVFDVPGGAIEVPRGISIDGGTGTDNRIQIQPQAGISYRRGLLNDPVPATGSFSFSLADRYSNVATQTISWSSIQHGSESAGPVASSVEPIRDGWQNASLALQHGQIESANGTNLAALSLTSVTAGLNGQTRISTVPIEDRSEDSASEGDAGAGRVQNRTSLLRRILEEGLNGIQLTSIGTAGSISTPQQLRTALDALDAIPGNVTLDSTTDHDGDGRPDLLFHAQINKTLGGGADLAIAAGLLNNLGQFSLTAGVDFTADVKLDLTFGVDGIGFVIQPTSASEVQISNLQLTGEINGEGRIGFLGVEIKGASVTMDAGTSITLDLLDPGTDVADGLIRMPELTPEDFTTLFRMQVKPAPGDGSDLVLAGDFAVSAVIPGLNVAIPLAQSRISISWPVLNVADAVNLVPGGLADDADAMLKFANLAGVDVFVVKK